MTKSKVLKNGFLVVFCLFLSLPAYALWDSKRDNKPVAELELMDNKELAFEALGVCHGGAISTKTGNLFKAQDASDYLTLIGRVYRKHLGRDLNAITDLKIAISKGLMDDCAGAMKALRVEADKSTKKK